MLKNVAKGSEVLREKQRRLKTLEVQAARYGVDYPAHITSEIEALRKEIAKLTG